MFKRSNIVKKISAILMSVIVCSTSAISGYASESFENSSTDELGGIETLDVILKDEDGYITSGKWECENGIIVELVDNVLTISGNGVPGNDVREVIIETACNSSKYKRSEERRVGKECYS